MKSASKRDARLNVLVVVFLSLLLLLCSCSRAAQPSTPPPGQTPTPTPKPTSKPAQKVLADTFFYGHAYVDANGNGEIDPEDPGLKGALFQVALTGGLGNSAKTGTDGSAFIVIPGGVSKAGWPVRARMNPPPDTDYEWVGPAEIVLDYPETSVDFLFSAPK